MAKPTSRNAQPSKPVEPAQPRGKTPRPPRAVRHRARGRLDPAAERCNDSSDESSARLRPRVAARAFGTARAAFTARGVFAQPRLFVANHRVPTPADVAATTPNPHRTRRSTRYHRLGGPPGHRALPARVATDEIGNAGAEQRADDHGRANDSNAHAAPPGGGCVATATPLRGAGTRDADTSGQTVHARSYHGHRTAVSDPLAGHRSRPCSDVLRACAGNRRAALVKLTSKRRTDGEIVLRRTDASHEAPPRAASISSPVRAIAPKSRPGRCDDALRATFGFIRSQGGAAGT